MTESSELWRQAKDIVADALDLAPAQLEAWIAQRCGENAALLQEVRSLLAFARDTAAFIDAPARLDVDAIHAASGSADAWAGQTLGAWRLGREIGRGGMGVVYLAQRADGAYQQSAAVKLLRASTLDARSVARMQRERQTLAQLTHPNIARLLDGGSAADGTPYLVLEFVEGLPINQFCEQKALPATSCIALMLDVCAAVQSAHQRLVIHRDIKPTNVLVTQDGVPKLLDFGVARLLESHDGAGADHDHTHGALLFTPRFASPEQVRGLPVSVATDVYGLGLLLYELLAGDSPYQRLSSKSATDVATSAAAAMQAVMNDALRNPAEVARTHRPQNATLLTGDLGTILLKACAKDANQRYATVEALSEDLRRFLQQRPITARAPTWTYVATQFVRRHRWGVALGALAVVAVVAGFAGTVVQKNRAEAEQAKAEARYQQVRNLASRMLTDYNDAIAKLPGSTELRQRMTSDAVKHLDELAREVPNDPSLALQMAEAYRKLGTVSYSENRASLGQGKLLDESLKKSEALLAEASGHQAAGADRELQLQWGETHRALARRARTQGDYDKAQQLWEEVVARFEALTKDAPREEQYRFQTLDSYYSLAALANVYQRRSAQAYLEGARRGLEGWQALSPAAEEKDYMALRALRADYQQAQFERKLPEAIAFISQEVLLHEKRVRASPENAAWIREFAMALKTKAGMQMVGGKFADALGAQEQALALMQPLMKADADDVQAKTEVLWLLRDRGISLANLERRQEAMGEFDKAFALCAPMTDTDQTTLMVVRLCVNAAWWTTRSRLRFDRAEEAKISAQRILSIRDKFPKLFESKLEQLWLKNAEEALAGLPLSAPNTDAPITRPTAPAASAPGR